MARALNMPPSPPPPSPPPARRPLKGIRNPEKQKQTRAITTTSYWNVLVWVLILLVLMLGVVFLFSPLAMRWKNGRGFKRGIVSGPASDLVGHGTVIGIDLGSENLRVAVKRDGTFEVIPDADGNKVTPSWVSFHGHEILMGEGAKKALHSNAKNTVFNVKRLIGRKMSDLDLQRELRTLPFAVSKGKDGRPVIQVEYQGEMKNFTPEEITGMLLSRLKANAEVYLGESVTHAVVAVPANFNDAQRLAINMAGGLAGLNILRIINEPTAASIGFGLHKIGYPDGEGVIVLYNLGAGFRASVVTIDDGIFEVLSDVGDANLGGQGIQRRVMEFIQGRYMARRDGRDVGSEDNHMLGKLRMVSEEVIRNLSTETNTEFVIEGLDVPASLTREKFEELNMELFRGTIHLLEEALKEADVTKERVDKIVLTGASTRIPKVHQLITEYFGKEPSRFPNIEPEEAVVYGAANQAAILAESNGISECPPMVDITPLSFGIETVDGVFYSIIPRNTVFPTMRQHNFTTMADNQTSVTIKVYEGERGRTAYNKLVGEFDLNGIAPSPKGAVQIEVTFEMDANYVLKVKAEDRARQISETMTIFHSDRYDQDEVDRIILNAERFTEQDAAYRAWTVARLSSPADGLNHRHLGLGGIDENASRDRQVEMCQDAGEFSQTCASEEAHQRQYDLL